VAANARLANVGRALTSLGSAVQQGLETAACPLVNLPEPKNARQGLAITREVMPLCRWLKPKVVVQVEFVEWTDEGHLRHARFIGLRDDKNARDVTREPADG
jgi:ATP-dependent DNA ligase